MMRFDNSKRLLLRMCLPGDETAPPLRHGVD
jgi:hypothetical protein